MSSLLPSVYTTRYSFPCIVDRLDFTGLASSESFHSATESTRSFFSFFSPLLSHSGAVLECTLFLLREIPLRTLFSISVPLSFLFFGDH